MAQPPSRPPRDLPQVSDSVDPAIRGPLSRVIEELQRLLEFRGDPLDAALTLRKAMARGLVDNMGRALVGDVTYVNTFPTTGGSSGDAPDLTPPPNVTGLSVVAGFSQVIVQFDAPTYSQGHGNLQTNIYANRKDPGDPTLPTFGDAVLVFSAPGALNIVSIPSELNTRWHVWAKYKTVDGVESVAAAGGANGYNVAGVYPTTGQDVAQLLEVLDGQIREGQLYASLAEPIRSIIRRADDAAEDALRSALATHEASRRAVAGLLAEIAARGTAIAQTQVLITQGDTQLAALITALQATVNNPVTGVAATALALEAVETLASDTADSVVAVAGRTSLLEASVDTPTTGLLARAGLLETAVAEANDDIGAVATRTSTLEARVESPSATPGDPDYNPTYAALQTTQSTLATLDGRASSTYAVRTTISAGGRTLLGGFGLMGDSAAAPGSEIEFGILANRFWVGAPIGSGVGDSQLFTLQTTTWDDNGVSRPAGAFIDAAFIKNLTAIYATIASLVADDITAANISAAQITFGSMSGDRIAVNSLQADRIQTWSLAATQAIIADLSVNTLKIANNAVTVPVFTKVATAIYISSTTPVVIMSAFFPPEGAPLSISVMMQGVQSSGLSTDVLFVQAFLVDSTGTESLIDGYSIFARAPNYISFIDAITFQAPVTGSGSWGVRIKASLNNNLYGYIVDVGTSMIILGTKK